MTETPTREERVRTVERDAAYDPAALQEKWLPVWDELEPFRPTTPDDDRREAVRARHVPVPVRRPAHGSRRGVRARRRHRALLAQQGYNVLHPIGWDSFGLPAENAAIKRGHDPRDVDLRQHRAAEGEHAPVRVSFDWDRVLHTRDPEYYRWNQWLFLKLYERGLAYRKAARSTGARSTRPCSRTSRW